MTTSKTKKCIVARSVSYPVGMKPAQVERTYQKKKTEEKRLYTGEP
jgi:hypothetical protein